MNSKGQFTVGAFIVLFISIVVGLALFIPTAQYTSDVVNLGTVVNQTVTLSATTPVVLTGKVVTGLVVTNKTSPVVVAAGNYTLTNNEVSTGTIRATLVGVTSASGYQVAQVNVSYTYEPLGYAEDNGSRAVTNMIVIFGALSVAIYVLWQVWENGLSEVFGM